MLPDSDALGLRALGCVLFDELHRRIGLEVVEAGMHHVLPAEVQLASVGGLDETISLFP